MKKIYVLIGTRPNFIKVTQFRRYAEMFGLDLTIIHTGQHYDYKMSGVFFDQFNLKPDVFLEIPKGSSPSSQIANIILKLEDLILKKGEPNIFLVVGDVNSTLAGALFAQKNNIKIGHIESGLRSFDNTMPEEINRLITDRITDYFFITEESGLDNLMKEGYDREKMFFVGNTMIDTLVGFEDEIDASEICETLNLETSRYVLMTMHRPSSVDNKIGLQNIISIIAEIQKYHTVVFPIHPRTKNRFDQFALSSELKSFDNLILLDPTGYFEFQKLIKNAKFVITDSGGIQEETTFRKIPCLTLRPNTERPSTIEVGSNTLMSIDDLDLIINEIRKIETGSYKKGEIPKFWDGMASKRIFEAISKLN